MIFGIFFLNTYSILKYTMQYNNNMRGQTGCAKEHKIL